MTYNLWYVIKPNQTKATQNNSAASRCWPMMQRASKWSFRVLVSPKYQVLWVNMTTQEEVSAIQKPGKIPEFLVMVDLFRKSLAYVYPLFHTDRGSVIAWSGAGRDKVSDPYRYKFQVLGSSDWLLYPTNIFGCSDCFKRPWWRGTFWPTNFTSAMSFKFLWKCVVIELPYLSSWNNLVRLNFVMSSYKRFSNPSSKIWFQYTCYRYVVHSISFRTFFYRHLKLS